MPRRVVITACSAITPIGHTKEDIVNSLVHGISGVKPLREDDLLSRYIHSKVFGTVDYPIDRSRIMPVRWRKKFLRRLVSTAIS